MKRTILVILAVLGLAACDTDGDTEDSPLVFPNPLDSHAALLTIGEIGGPFHSYYGTWVNGAETVLLDGYTSESIIVEFDSFATVTVDFQTGAINCVTVTVRPLQIDQTECGNRVEMDVFR